MALRKVIWRLPKQNVASFFGEHQAAGSQRGCWLGVRRDPGFGGEWEFALPRNVVQHLTEFAGGDVNALLKGNETHQISEFKQEVWRILRVLRSSGKWMVPLSGKQETVFQQLEELCAAQEEGRLGCAIEASVISTDAENYSVLVGVYTSDCSDTKEVFGVLEELAEFSFVRWAYSLRYKPSALTLLEKEWGCDRLKLFMHKPRKPHEKAPPRRHFLAPDQKLGRPHYLAPKNTDPARKYETTPKDKLREWSMDLATLPETTASQA